MRLSTVDKSETVVNPELVQESLAKYNLLFNDARSPIYSAISTISKNNSDIDSGDYELLYHDLEDFIENRIDLEGL